MSYVALKAAIYVFLTLFGAALLAFAFFAAQKEGMSNQLAAWIMLLSGSVLTLFGFLTFVLKDDPDVWR